MELIVFVGNNGYAYEVMEAAKKLGATSGTILHGRSSRKSDKKLFGVTIHQEKEVLLIVTISSLKKIIMEGLNKNYGISSEAEGITFSLTISDAFGIDTNIRDLGDIVI